MSYNFTLADMSEFMYSPSNENDYSIHFPNKMGSLLYEKKVISDDIFLFKSEVLTHNTFVIQSNQKINGLFMGILLDGTICYKENSLHKNETLKKNNIKITYINEFDMTTIFENHSCGIGLFIKNDFLEKHFSKIFDFYSGKLHNFSSITLKNENSNNIHLVKELFHSPFQGELHHIYLQSKVLEIIYNEFNTLTSSLNTDNKRVKLTQMDIEALHKAKEIILLSLNFPDLPTLAKKVALNEFKLKYGFKQLFNTSPGNMILEQKMLKAKKMLETSEYSIAEISNFVGYKHQQSFTNAFIHFFGIRPKDVMKTRSYYY